VTFIGIYIARYFYLAHHHDEITKMATEDVGHVCTILCTFCVTSWMCLHHLKHKYDTDKPSGTPIDTDTKRRNYYNLYSNASYNPVFYWSAVGGHDTT
jgi:hypothetical protein